MSLSITSKWMLPVAMLAAIYMTACIDDDERCSPGQFYESGICVSEPDSDGSTASDDAATDGSLNETADAAEPSALGDECFAPKDCVGEVSYCAILPGKSSGQCTIPGCDLKNDDCPDGFKCFDLPSMIPTEPTICIYE